MIAHSIRFPRFRQFGLAGLYVLFSGWPSLITAADLAPLADAHTHYNWDQAEDLSPEEVIARLKRNGVVLAVVSSTPPELALELRRIGGDWIVPLFRPYLEPGRRRSWFLDERVLPRARAGLQAGLYAGIGEIHLVAGMAPSLRKPQPVIDGMFDLAREFDVPVQIHAEASSHRYWLPLCRRHPQVRIVWAHAGGILPPHDVAALLEQCTNVFIDLSARDPDRYGLLPIADSDGALLPEWEQLVRRFSSRVMLGSDAVYREELLYWEESDTGWDHVDDWLGFHRAWLERLPPQIADKIRLTNAREFFRKRATAVTEP